MAQRATMRISSSFKDRLRCVINTTHVGLVLALAKDVGIWKILILYYGGALSAQEIADKKNCKERYVREILDCLVTAGIVRSYTDKKGIRCYYLTKNDRTIFKSSKKTFISFPVAMMKAYDKVKQCFDIGQPGGFDFNSSLIPNCYEALYYRNILTYISDLHMDHGDLMKSIAAGAEVAEVGSEYEMIVCLISIEARKNPFVITGTKRLIRNLQRRLRHRVNLTYQEFDVFNPMSVSDKKYDCVFCLNVVHKAPNPTVVLNNVKKLLKPAGTFMMIEKMATGTPINNPDGMELARMFALSAFFCVPKCLYKDPACDPLGPCWDINSAKEMVKAAGFELEVQYLSDDILFACRFGPIKTTAGAEVAEVGSEYEMIVCLISIEARKNPFVITGTKRLIRNLQRRLRHRVNLTYQEFDVFNPMSVSDKKYDCVFCLNVVHKAPNPTVVLNNIKKLLKPAGTFMMIEKMATGTPINNPDGMELARMFALSAFFCVPKCLYKDPACDPLGPCWDINSAKEMVKAAGFELEVQYLSDDILFACRFGPIKTSD